jgi:hypothetical protein
VGKWERYTITVRGRQATITSSGGGKTEKTLPDATPGQGALGLSDVGGSIEFGNLYVRDL